MTVNCSKGPFVANISQYLVYSRLYKLRVKQLENVMRSAPKLVAIVDDEVDVAHLFKQSLRDFQNVRIFAFTDSQMALEHFTINKDNYALIISDLRMPGLNGIELIKKVKSLNPFVRVVLMTAFEFDDEMFEDYTKKRLINGFLQKPIRLNDFQAQVNQQLDAYELQKQKPLLRI